MSEANPTWIAELERAIPELAGSVSVEARPHAQVAPITAWVQAAITADDLETAGRGFDWVNEQLLQPSMLQRQLSIYFVSMIHFTGMDLVRRNQFFERMPAKLFRLWRELNHSIDAAHELEK